MKANDKYLETFFEEKGLEPQVFEVAHGGTIHLVESGVIIEMVKGTQGEEKESICRIIRTIDFKNGDVNHFLSHLAEGYVKTNF